MYEQRNWSRVHRFRPYAVHHPSSEDEVAEILRAAAALGHRVKVIGAGHSWSDAAVTSGHLLNLDHMNRVLEVDRERARVTVEAGMRLYQLNDILAAHGLALPVLGSVSQQSVAGAIATGTHGSGVGFGCISSGVLGLRLIRADGEPVDIGEDDAEMLSAARVHVGALGVVTRVTLQCEPAFNLRERVTVVDLDDALARMDEIATGGEHVKLWWLPHTHAVRISTLDRTDEPPDAPGPLVRVAEGALQLGTGRAIDLPAAVDTFLNERAFAGMLSLSARRPAMTPAINKLIAKAYFSPGRRVARGDRVFNLTMPPIHREAEFGVPRKRTADALAGLAELIDRERLYVNFIVEVRFVAADDIMLSGAYGRDSCQLGAYIGDCRSCEPYFRGIEELCRPMGGRPHWGKEFLATRDELREAYPMFDRFDAIRRELDPDGLFENDFIRRVFAS